MQKIKVAMLFFALFTLGFVSCNSLASNNMPVQDMNVVMDISVPDILKTMAKAHATDSNFTSAIIKAEEMQENRQNEFVDLFTEAFKATGSPLNTVFSTQEMKERINATSSDDQVSQILKEEVKRVTEKTMDVLRSRLKRFGVKHPDIQAAETAGRIHIQMKGIRDPERILKLIQTPGHLELWETTDGKEVVQNIVAVNETGKESENQTSATEKITQEELVKINPLFALLITDVYSKDPLYHDPIIGWAMAKDTAKISEYLKTAKEKKIIPSNIYPSWAIKSISKESDIFNLIALSSQESEGRKAMDVNQVTKTKVISPDGHIHISLDLDDKDAKDLAELTKKNVGKTIATVWDGHVCSYPHILVEITVGHFEVVGNFTKEEAEDIANILMAKELPVPVKIIQSELY